MTQPFPCFTTGSSKDNECSYVSVSIRSKGMCFSGWNQTEVKLLLMAWSSLPFSCSNTKLFFCPDPKGNIKRKICYLFLQ